jgi:hypothetical protein
MTQVCLEHRDPLIRRSSFAAWILDSKSTANGSTKVKLYPLPNSDPVSLCNSGVVDQHTNGPRGKQQPPSHRKRILLQLVGHTSKLQRLKEHSTTNLRSTQRLLVGPRCTLSSVLLV